MSANNTEIAAITNGTKLVNRLTGQIEQKSRYANAPSPSDAISRLKPYSTVKQQALFMENPSDASKLDWNESTQKASKAVIDAVIESLSDGAMHWYPDVNSYQLITELAKYTSLPEACIQTFPGSDAALEYTCRTYLNTGDQVLMAGPTYDNFRIYAESCGADVVSHLGPSPFEPDTEGLISAISAKTKIIYIVTPNNPTGTVYTESDLRRILHAAPNALVIADEAYFEFCGLTHANLVLEFPNLLVSRSFSKAFGLASLRCGYVLTDSRNIAFLNLIRVGKNLSAPAQVGAIAALKDIETIKTYVQTVRKNMNILTTTLTNLGVEVVTTPANFLMLKVNQPEEVINFLNSKNIYIRNRSAMPQLKGFVRITVGDYNTTARVINAFKEMPENLYVNSETINEFDVKLRHGGKITLKRNPEEKALI